MTTRKYITWSLLTLSYGLIFSWKFNLFVECKIVSCIMVGDEGCRISWKRFVNTEITITLVFFLAEKFQNGIQPNNQDFLQNVRENWMPLLWGFSAAADDDDSDDINVMTYVDLFITSGYFHENSSSGSFDWHSPLQLKRNI